MRLLLTFLLNITLIMSLYSQNITYEYPVYYRIATAYNFKTSILSITFDDGNLVQFTKAVPLLNARNIPATFYILGYELSDSTFSNLVYNAYLNHHEIGSHSWGHPNLTKIDSSNVEYELSQSQKAINNLLKKNACLTMAYPFGAFNDFVIQTAKRYYIAGRTGQSGYNNINEIDKFRLNTIIYGPRITLGYYNHAAKVASRKGLWIIETFHGVDNEGFGPITVQDFATHLDIIKTLEPTMWFATVSNVIKYSDEKNSIKIFCDECDDGKFYKIRLDDNLDDSIYDQPLSITMKIPDYWHKINISGANYVDTIIEDGNKLLLFNALPNNKEILIMPEITSIPDLKLNIKFISVDPNPFNDYIDVSFETAIPSNVMIILKNIFGYSLLSESIVSNTISHVRLLTNQLAKGAYILELINKTNNQSITKKLIKIE